MIPTATGERELGDASAEPKPITAAVRERLQMLSPAEAASLEAIATSSALGAPAKRPTVGGTAVREPGPTGDVSRGGGKLSFHEPSLVSSAFGVGTTQPLLALAALLGTVSGALIAAGERRRRRSRTRSVAR